jgi:glutathione synthase/RimK-type ligase-like ATP-grasp enzyme
MRKTILALTHGRDDCADLVLAELSKMEADFVRFNTETFHTAVQMSLRLGSNGRFDGAFQFPQRKLPFEEVGVVWNRRVHEPEASNELDREPDLRDWVLQETKWAFNTAITMFDCPIVNPWEINERMKFNKLIQMKTAAEVGLEVPETLVTDELDRINEFWGEVKGEVIMKKIRKGLITLSDGRRALFHTSRIPPEAQTPVSLQRMRFAPSLLQAHIAKKYDIRSIVVGDRVFSVAIHSQGVPEGVVDYRNAAMMGRLRDMPHEIIDLGSEMNKKIIEFSRRFSLTFGALDFIETPDGRLIFLEDNPNGQWAWLEHLTGAPIAKAIAELLQEHCRT